MNKNRRANSPMLSLYSRSELDAIASLPARPRATAQRQQALNEVLRAELRALVNWYGVRGGEGDWLLPADEQPPEIRSAMTAIAKTDAEEKQNAMDKRN